MICSVGAAQENKQVKITPYTIETTAEKLQKEYPFVSPITPQVSPGIAAFENVTYKRIDSTSLKLDIYHPRADTTETFPAVLLIHGGGWVSGSRENQRPMAQQLAEHGYVGIAVSYRLSREAPYPAAVHDLKDALKWIRQHAPHYRIDRDNLVVLGASAGAQLATLIGVTSHTAVFETPAGASTPVQAIVNIDGIVSFIHPEAQESSIAGLWLGGLEHENPKNWREASPLEYVGKDTPPTLFINSSQPRFHAGRDDMIKILDSLGTYHEVHSIADTPHSFWLVHPWFEETKETTLQFLDRIFKN